MAFTTPKSNHNNHQTTTPSSCKSNNPKTPLSKHRLNFTKPSPNPNSTVLDHPVEVIGRIRDYPEKPISSILHAVDSHSLRVRTDIGYRDFTLDGVSVSRDQDLDGFYAGFVQSRVSGVKLGEKCTILMYGPTGSGKSHTMFGCASKKQQGIVYRSLKDILGSEDGEQQRGAGFVQVTVLEIYNEEIFDLLSTNGTNGGFGIGFARGNASKVKLEVMGKKAKNATFISGTEAGKISKEIQKVEKRRIVKSTFCNERSSRSHCLIILDVPTVGGRLMLVDMAGSENIEQAGQTGFEAKMQTAKINQGNIALKRVVESIANGDSHVPFRDSKLTMLLQVDSFEDDKSKILMILCASPDPKEMHKTISTLEYGAKAKCIVRGPHTPIKADDSSSSDVKEKNEAHKQLMKKEEEIACLRAKLAEAVEKKSDEEEINMKVTERENMLKRELEKKIQECQKMADQVVEMERRKMEEKIFQQQAEVEMLRRRLEEIESELTRSRDGKENENRNIASMDLDKSLDMDVGGRHKTNTSSSSIQAILGYPFMDNLQNDEYEGDAYVPTKAVLSTVFEEDEEEDDEVQKEVIEERTLYPVKNPSSAFNFDIDSLAAAAASDDSECMGQDTASTRHLRIQNIFTLCGNYRELSHHTPTPLPTTNNNMTDESPVRPTGEDKPEIKQSLTDKMMQVECDSKENCSPALTSKSSNDNSDVVEVVVKWEAASVENGGGVITTLRLVKDSTLADLRKLIEIYLAADNQAFTFLALGGDPTGAPVAKEDEASVVATKLPTCSNSQTRMQHLACLRPSKKLENKHPLTSMENKLPFAASLEKKLPFSSIENIVPGISADSVIGLPHF
ncbi:kinesin-like protein KIN-10A [Tanacetum coccineum]